MTVPVIDCRDLDKIYERGASPVAALQKVSVRIDAGEFIAIIGASGSGKSTFMNLLGCLDRPTRGSYRLAGRDVAELTPDERAELRNREIGFVFQAFNLIPRMSALENVEIPLVYCGVSPREQRERAAAALREVRLGERASHHPSELSGGEQQRVAIARALVNGPRILLADEPTGNLDTVTSLDIMDLLSRLHRDEGLTVVLVTHERDIAAFAERLLEFEDGQLIRDTPIPGVGP